MGRSRNRTSWAHAWTGTRGGVAQRTSGRGEIQRPGVEKQILEDLTALADMSAFIDKHSETGERHDFSQMVAEFRKSLLDERDYLQEAAHLKALGENLKAFPTIIVP